MDQSSVMMMIGGISGTIISVLSAYFLIIKFIIPFFKRVNKWISTWENFMEDWAGEEARPGRDAVPGVMERLNSIDGELKNNGGSSIKDAVNRIEKRLEDGAENFIEIDYKLENLENRISKLEDNN